jgi:hypothetical protein
MCGRQSQAAAEGHAMGESRDANDPRDQLRAMNKQARAEFEREEEGDTGGGEHASRAEREGVPVKRREAGSPAEPPTADRPRR